ncbi:hypothetical protein ADIS_1423 [Lunatimonas lonarensis]|uniref:Uncharacterized protein n=1 Tax=Lunatimonas lonarensis TaxID=1232681 RepID=R7ZVQ0_9BACT|nr:contractile injection system tape measure protein [Lunatimonas lonarensis]EON78226.1 hypothetical protein ADIS_1423 [Lunatimonas lonarensis]
MKANRDEILIQKVNVEVITHTMDAGRSVEQNIHEFLERQVFPRLEDLLREKWSLPPNQSLQLDELSLTVQVNSPSSLLDFSVQSTELDWIDQLETQLHGVLKSKTDRLLNSPDTASSIEYLDRWDSPSTKNNLNSNHLYNCKPAEYRLISDEKKSLFAWLHFVRHGTKPWFAAHMTAVDFMPPSNSEKWIQLPEFKDLTANVMSQPESIGRLFLQHSQKDVTLLMYHLLGDFVDLPEFARLNGRFKSSLQRINRVILFFLWIRAGREGIGRSWSDCLTELKSIVPVLGIPTISVENWLRFWNLLPQIRPFKPELDQTAKWLDSLGQVSGQGFNRRSDESINFPNQVSGTKSSLQNESDKDTGIQAQLPLSNAGLILLHPFLPAFFSDVGVINEKQEFVDSHLAVHLLNYVATGNHQPYEFELGFEKFLTGWRQGYPYTRNVVLRESQREKADKLLESLLKNWKRLKNTGKDTLRAEFLQRSGKLVEEPGHYRLIVERKTQDILLEGLPYSLGVVKLPWQKKLIFIEW